MDTQLRVIRVLAWGGMLALFWLSPPALAMVCHQKGGGLYGHAADARIHYESVRSSSTLHTNEVIWHKHIDVPIQCSWKSGAAGDLSAQAGSNEPVLAFLHPVQAADEHDGLALGVSVNHAPIVYEQSGIRTIDTGFRMPSYRAERVCEHHDTQGCRHWREALNRDYRTPVDFVVPLDLYVRRLPGAMTRITDTHVLLQLGGELNSPGGDGVQVALRGLSSLARTPCRSAVQVMPPWLDFSDAWSPTRMGSGAWQIQRPFDIRITHQCNGNIQQLGLKASFHVVPENGLSEAPWMPFVDGQRDRVLDLILLDSEGHQVPLQQAFALDPVAIVSDDGVLSRHFVAGHLWRSPSAKQVHASNKTLVLNITYR